MPARATPKSPAPVLVELVQALAPIGTKVRDEGAHTATRSRAQFPVFVRSRIATRPPSAESSLAGPASERTAVFAELAPASATSPTRSAREITDARVAATEPLP